MLSKLWRTSTIIFLIIFLSGFYSLCFSQEVKVRIVKKDAVLRLEPDKNSVVIRELPLGTEFRAEEIIGQWIKLALPPDKDGIVVVGYVHKSFIEIEMRQPDILETKEVDPEPLTTKPELRVVDKTVDYYDWERQYASAKGKRSMGTTLIVAGSIVLVTSAALYFLAPKKDAYVAGYWVVTVEEKNSLYLITGGIGLLTDIIGIAIYSSGNKQVKQLKREGNAKGYIKAGILPEHHAIGVQFCISF